MQQEATTTNYKVGDKVKVKSCIHGHLFDIDETVKIIDADEVYDSYECCNGKKQWYLKSAEFTPVAESENDLAVLDTDLYERMYDQGENPNIAQPASNEATVNIRIVPKKSGAMVFIGTDEYGADGSDKVCRVMIESIVEKINSITDTLCGDPASINITVRIVVNPA